MGYQMSSASYLVFLLCFGVHLVTGEIKCYNCSPEPLQVPQSNLKPCSSFEKTAEFEISCPYSSMCMKKITEYTLQSKEIIKVTTRGCAYQKDSGYVLDLKLRNWTMQDRIDDTVYKEGCTSLDSTLKSVDTKYCFCSSNYCNSSQKSKESTFFHYIGTMSVIFIFNVVRYLESIL